MLETATRLKCKEENAVKVMVKIFHNAVVIVYEGWKSVLQQISRGSCGKTQLNKQGSKQAKETSINNNKRYCVSFEYRLIKFHFN